MTEMREYDIGVELLVTLTNSSGTAFDVSTATTIQFKFRKPSGTEISRTGVLDSGGTDGKVRYVTIEDDLDEIGIWRYQVRIVLASGTDLTSEDAKFRVADAIGKP